MDNITSEFITLLQYLLPGFLAAWIYYSFTSVPKPSQFERIVQALIFTLFAQAGVHCFKTAGLWLETISSGNLWRDDAELVTSVFCACALGFMFAYFTNSDIFHALARKVGITRETAYPSEWFGSFSKSVTYVVLHLEDGRRIYGWPREWPSDPGKGHFSMEQVSWLLENGEQTPMAGVESMLIRAETVKWVEFMEFNMEQDNE